MLHEAVIALKPDKKIGVYARTDNPIQHVANHANAFCSDLFWGVSYFELDAVRVEEERRVVSLAVLWTLLTLPSRCLSSLQVAQFSKGSFCI